MTDKQIRNVPPQLWHDLKWIARERGMTMHGMIIKILEAWLRDWQRKEEEDHE